MFAVRLDVYEIVIGENNDIAITFSESLLENENDEVLSLRFDEASTCLLIESTSGIRLVLTQFPRDFWDSIKNCADVLLVYPGSNKRWRVQLARPFYV
jgi:hypothetical protein